LRREGAEKRNAKRTTGGDGALSHLAGAGTSEEAVLADLEHFIESLDERNRELLLLRLNGHTQVAIAERMKKSERWVREALKQLRERFTREAPEA
jgi:DNA-directed RNA polymerase specialized sigma24 family protein